MDTLQPAFVSCCREAMIKFTVNSISNSLQIPDIRNIGSFSACIHAFNASLVAVQRRQQLGLNCTSLHDPA